ncbi:MAG: outer membrane beta-barrel protein [Bacteroidota bacterium]
MNLARRVSITRVAGIVVLFLSLLVFSKESFGQTFTISGMVADSSDKEPVLGVTFSLGSVSDTNLKQIAVSDFDGSFSFPNVGRGVYILKGTYLGFFPFQRNIRVMDGDINIGSVSLVRSAKALNTVTVAGTQVRSEQNGDTTSFNAGAFKTNPDATAEDLLNKMPGISNDGGTLKANGEQVKKVLVDGKPFFGDDPNAAIKNLPSEIIDKIQIYDQGSEQSQFTGFDDGNNEKAINIITKKGRNNGVFGRVSGGYGLDETSNDGRYSLGGNINFFNGDRRVSLVGLTNNINQQNFSSDDLLGVSSSSSNSGSRGGGARGGRGGGGGSDASNFLVSQQGGITQTQSAGVNYADNWSKKLKVTGSYFFNRAENVTATDLSRNYILQNQDSSLIYNETGNTRSTNVNHRVAMRAEWNMDSNNAIILTPKISYQNNETNKDLIGKNLFNDNIAGSSLQNKTFNQNEGFNFSNNFLYRHKFAKKGRTISASIDTRINNRSGDGSLYSLNDYIDSSTISDQKNTSFSNSNTFSGSINYTEPINEKTQIQLNYNPSITFSESEKNTYNRAKTGEYTSLDSNLSNQFSNEYQTQRAGAGIRFSDVKINFNATLNGQLATLNGTQSFPNQLNITRNFSNILPQASFNYKFSKTENIRLFYRSSTNAPSISQLQNVVDNSNPLQLKVGNPDLQQDYTHSFNVRYGKTKAAKGNGMFLFANATVTNNYIGNSTTVGRDGVQISRPVNLNGYLRSNAFATYSVPFKKIKSNLNFNAGVNYTKTPSLINTVINDAKNYAFNGGFVLGSNISENIDFTVSYNGAYNIASNSSQPQSNFNYYSQTSSLKFNWIFLKGFVFNTNLNHTLYSGLGEGYDRDFLLWNASLGYKFLKNKALQADIYAFDILNQNNSINRSINDVYIEDSRTTVLQRFVMLKLTYTIRAFKSGAKMPEENKNEFEGRPPGGFQRGGGPEGGSGGRRDFGG